VEEPPSVLATLLPRTLVDTSPITVEPSTTVTGEFDPDQMPHNPSPLGPEQCPRTPVGGCGPLSRRAPLH
jgi:hypothetical protein